MVYDMKIRTITAGCNLSNSSIDKTEHLLDKIVTDIKTIKDFFIDQRYHVQTTRLSTQPWEEYATTQQELDQICSALQSLCPDSIDYFNIGPVSTLDKIDLLPSFLKSYPQGFCTVNLLKQHKIQHDLVWKTAELIKKISTYDTKGFTNLQFAALCNVKSNTPFYPASYHKGTPSFGIGFENSDIIYNVCSKSSSYEEAFQLLNKTLTKEYQKIEKLSRKISKKTHLKFYGIDASISPSVHPKESFVYGVEQLPFLNYFGGPATLTAARLITSVLQQLPITHCGYNGLMLPVLEDSGLATRNREGKLSLTKLLLYSSVCGTGLDTIPLPGDISVEALNGILLDVASLSAKLDKPLSARLMPIPLKKAGEDTEFSFEYFENTTVMNP
jgi:uncharacterized protein (UPF0210 family)